MASEGSQAAHQHQFSIHDGRSGLSKRPPPAQIGRDPRIKTACTECKRRKVKCDGSHPCYSCQWYKQPERCTYPFTQPALGVNRKNFDYVRKRLETTTHILTKLFPSESIDALEGLSGQQLVERIITTIPSSEAEQSPGLPSVQNTTPGRGSVVSHETNVNVPTRAALDASIRAEENRAQPESSSSESGGHDDSADDNVSDTGDDVNAVSTTDSHASSYVGPSSTMQMFRTILRIAPDSLEKKAQHQSPPRSVLNTSTGSSSRHLPMPLTDRMRALIDAYFHWVHPTTAIIDEATFRETALSGHRTDPPWLCLLNTVLALGSLGCTKTESKEHMTYYNVAKSYLDLEALGNKSLEFLQALMLMAGWYCHYRNRPNLASALLGVAFRMAYALGVHKETPAPGQTEMTQELRRTIWWNLVVLDAAEAATLGRNLDGSIFDSEVRYPGGMQQEVSPSIVLVKDVTDVNSLFSQTGLMTNLCVCPRYWASLSPFRES